MTQRSIGQLVLGTVVLLAGVVLLLDRLDVVSAGSVWSVFWPMLVTAFGVAALFVVPRAWLGPLLVTALGVYWLLEVLDVVGVSAWTYLLPVAIIVLGLSILVASTAGGVEADRLHALVFFWGSQRRTFSQQFRSAGLTSIFGGIDLDLRGANIVGRARVDAFTLFGGADLKVPPTWRVVITGLPVFGGWTDRTTPPAYRDAPELDVHVVAIFGGVTVKHGAYPAAAPPMMPAA
ncbi:MAG TPA: DUF5668 domain-containing protein [Cellulomonas sp.]